MGNLMLCPTCRGGVTYITRNQVEAYCTKCNGFLWFAGTVKEILKYNQIQHGDNNKLY